MALFFVSCEDNYSYDGRKDYCVAIHVMISAAAAKASGFFEYPQQSPVSVNNIFRCLHWKQKEMHKPISLFNNALLSKHHFFFPNSTHSLSIPFLPLPLLSTLLVRGGGGGGRANQDVRDDLLLLSESVYLWSDIKIYKNSNYRFIWSTRNKYYTVLYTFLESNKLHAAKLHNLSIN